MKYLLVGVILFIGLAATANDSTRLYNPYANVALDVQSALIRAKKEKKQVLLQIGGNWCIMCYRFNSLVKTDTVLKQLLAANYITYHLNYSKENRNLAYLKKLGNPQRFGFPVLVVLEAATGNVLHTQNGAQLLKGNGYDSDKIQSFLKKWATSAVEEALQKE